MIRKPSRKNPRDGDDYTRFRRAVLKRDKYRCQMPGCQTPKTRLQVHHIVRHADSYAGRLNPSNGVVVCFNCHKNVVTGNERHYASMFFGIVKRNEESS